MTENMKHWDALKTTDPKYTKKVEFGRKFTSINSQWQLQRMTEQFGPIGKGWGYHVQHSTERLHDWYVLAVADVTVWWRDPEQDKVAEYGPVRGTSPVLEPARDKGRLLYEADGQTVKLHLDDDAGKKAMTDALTKGLSHLGLSADVFLGLFDDNKYVQNVKEQFANGGQPEAAPQQQPSSGPSSAHGRQLAAAEPQLIDKDRQKGTLPGKKTTAEERAAKIKDATDKRVKALKDGAPWVRQALDDFWHDNATWIDWMSDPNNMALQEYERFSRAFADAETTLKEIA